MFYLALIIPSYNEEYKIKSTFVEYFNYFQKNPHFEDKKIVIILVNDGSLDKTKNVITELENFSNGNITVKTISYEQNRGKGAAIKRGCETIDSEFYGFVDADLSFKPELTERAISILEDSEFEIVIGQRQKNKNASAYAKISSFFSLLLRRIVNSFLSLPNLDTQYGFKFFKKIIARDILPKIKENRFAFDIELIISALQNKHRVKTLPVIFEHKNKSSITWKDGVRYILDTISISERLKSINFKKLILKLILVSTAISFAVFGWVIFKGYLFSDDFTWLWHGQKIDNSLHNILTFRMSTFYSPTMNAFYSLMYSISGYNPQPLFLIGVGIHILVSLLAGIFVWQLSKSKLISIITSCLVAFAGTAYEPLVWISANMHSLVSLFILICLVSFYKYLSTEKIFYLILSFVSFVLALGTKESAIITPALLFATFIYYKIENKRKLKKTHLIFWGGIILLSIIYLYQQFFWQKSSIWVQTGVYGINFATFFRIPFILMDNFIPISLFNISSAWIAGLLWLVATSIFSFILFKFKKLKLIWFGFFWLLVSISPFIFFKAESWWEPLASRYNYLPRIGAIIILTAILQYLITQNKSRYIISGLIYFVVISIFAQLFIVEKAISTEYEYVYNTGRSLTETMQTINKINPDKILVRWDHPFTANNAHIIGAASIIANINESDINFLEKNSDETLEPREILMYWNPQIRRYEIKQHN